MSRNLKKKLLFDFNEIFIYESVLFKGINYAILWDLNLLILFLDI